MSKRKVVKRAAGPEGIFLKGREVRIGGDLERRLDAAGVFHDSERRIPAIRTQKAIVPEDGAVPSDEKAGKGKK